MITEQSLRKDVLQYLRTNYSIKIELPVFRRQIQDRISLKLFRSPLGQILTENRYMILIKQSEELLKRNIINTQKIKEFGQHFFETVTNDIQVLQGNEEIRRGFTRIRDQITYRIEELGAEQRGIEEDCRAINDKQEILTFLQGSFKNYLSKVKTVSQHYQAVNNVQVLTSINLDDIYSQRLAQEEDYLQHYQPLLEVMQRLKNNMVKLYQQLNRCEYYELPLRSVNFLANCKNLLMELQPFLIRPDCVFNRLIIHVTKGQKDNNQLIGRVFQVNIAFSNDVVSDVFKAFFLGHIFQDYYRTLKAKIEQEKADLITQFQLPITNSDNFYGYVLKVEKKIGEIRNEIDSLKSVIGMGKDKIMREYLGRKECKKFNLLISLEEQNTYLGKFSRCMLNMLKFKGRIYFVGDRLSEYQRECKKTVSIIKQQQSSNFKKQKLNMDNVKEKNDQIQKKFEQSYLMIQDGILQLNQTKKVLNDAKEQINQQYFSDNYFPLLEQTLKDYEERYSEVEVSLLNSYQSLRKEKIAKSEQARERSKVLLQQLSDYFQSKVSVQNGFQIKNEDDDCELVKDNIIKVQQVQYLLNSYVGTKGDDIKELSRYKMNLQWLLQVFEGSMDQKIFQNFMQKLNFQAQDWKERVARVRELLRQISRYLASLKKILKMGGSDIFSKVFKLVKNRVQLYQVMQDMYEQFLTVYQNSVVGAQLNPRDNGLKLFDEATYKYVMSLYQFRNRMRAEMEELKDLLLPRRTLNYLLDDLYQPYVQIFNNFTGFNQQELLNFTLRLQHALNFKLSHNQITKLFEQTLIKQYSAGFFQSVYRLCEQLVQLGKQNQKVIQLQKQEVMVYNLTQFKQKHETVKEHVLLASSLLRGITVKNMDFQIQLENKTLVALKDKIVGDWDDHRQEIQRSLAVSRADDFSHNQA